MPSDWAAIVSLTLLTAALSTLLILPPGLATAWLLARGFAPANWGNGRIWEFGQVRSIFGAEKEIEVTVADQGDEGVVDQDVDVRNRAADGCLVEAGEGGAQIRLAQDAGVALLDAFHIGTVNR